MDSIQKAVDGVMALRPTESSNSQSRQKRDKRRAETLKRMNDRQFQKEMEMIMNGEIPDYGAFFFTNNEPGMKRRKNANFNQYLGKAE
ncbi:hypothetical protein [Vibrio cholerae]|uniref:hypothetical protein n=1 Tax=Vibrio cholerae TaxID=666 RepID=UPI0011D337DD|nr:hypothetical protein [Vibrio cholerae]TYA60808.1 hypothetical protein FXE55_02285 [Vibrio cholerae]GHW54598.1 hypothetical protein VCSRO57_2365 [Vibrio cholerae]